MFGILPIPAGGRINACRLRIGGPPVLVKPRTILADTPSNMLLINPTGPNTCRYSVVSFNLPVHFTLRPYHFTNLPCGPR